jgi:UDP-3-O-[3-hydroxymyristoyl] glucosamine N-acyltransferase
MKTFTLGEIARVLNLSVPAKCDLHLTGVNSLAEACSTEISFVGSDRFLKELADTRAAAVLVQRNVKVPPGVTRPILWVDDADLAMVKVLEMFAPPVPGPKQGIDPSARLDATVTVGDGSAIGAFVSIGANSRIGARCIIHPGVIIGDEVIIGDDCQIQPNVVIRERIVIGNRVILNAGAVLGTDGFGYRWDGKQHLKVPQIGTVIVEDDVELGSCVCVDRAKYGATRIGKGTKIDNLVQIAHNVVTGAHCIMAGQTGIAGSTTLGDGVVVGGATSIRDHVTIGSMVVIGARSGVIEDIKSGATVSGAPAIPHRQALREQAALRRLPDLWVQSRKAQEQLEELLKLKDRIEGLLKNGNGANDVVGT